MKPRLILRETLEANTEAASQTTSQEEASGESPAAPQLQLPEAVGPAEVGLGVSVAALSGALAYGAQTSSRLAEAEAALAAKGAELEERTQQLQARCVPSPTAADR